MNPKAAVLVLVIVLGGFLAFRWRDKNSRGSGEAGSTAAASAAPTAGSAATPGGSHQAAGKTERAPVKPPRSGEPLDLGGLQKALKAKAEQATLQSGGDEAATAQVQIEFEKLKAFEQAGMGLVHPNVVIARLRLAKELDQVGDSDREASDARMTGYLDGLQAELEDSEDGKPVADLVTRWRRELKRDDSFEATVIASLGALTKEGLQGRLKFFRDGIAPPPEQE